MRNTSLVTDRRREPRSPITDRRREPRLHVKLEVSAVLLDDPNNPFQCQLEDISQSGARILMSGPVRMDCLIKFEWDRYVVVGRPRYLKLTPAGYLVGLQVLMGGFDGRA